MTATDVPAKQNARSILRVPSLERALIQKTDAKAPGPEFPHWSVGTINDQQTINNDQEQSVSEHRETERSEAVPLFHNKEIAHGYPQHHTEQFFEFRRAR